MRKLVFAGLGALVFASSTFCSATSASANKIIEGIAIRQGSRITPYNLVSSGYQGLFKPFGIPAASVFVRNAQSGKLTAVELIQAGITSGRLAESALEDRSYVQAVDNVLTRNVRK